MGTLFIPIPKINKQEIETETQNSLKCKYYVMIHTTEVFETNDLLAALRLHRNIRKDKRFYPIDVNVMERADTGIDKYIVMDSGDDDEIGWSITLKGINKLVKEVKENINKYLGE